MNPFCFIHIEKAAGTTLHHWFGNKVSGYYTFLPRKYSVDNPNPYLTLHELKRIKSNLPFFKGFGGHSLRSYLKYETLFQEELKYITFLREPLSRYLSHYSYQKEIMGVNWTLETFISDPQFNNFMTNRLSLRGDLNEAIQTLEKNFHFVGLTENFDESLILMNKFIFQDKLEPNYEVRNENKKVNKINFETLDDNLKKTLINNNDKDIQLYQYVIKNIFPKQREMYGKTLLLKVEELQNQKYKYSKTKERFFIMRNLFSNKFIEKYIAPQ